MKRSGIFRNLYPVEWVESTYSINYRRLYQRGFRGIIFDIDNTLVCHDAPADFRADRLVKELKEMGFQICLVSNNSEKRVKGFADRIGADYVYKAGKPSRKGFRKAMERMKTNTHTTVSIGDQIFTDIYGSNRSGICSILVKPIAKKEEFQIVLKRYLERIVLYFYKRQME